MQLGSKRKERQRRLRRPERRVRPERLARARLRQGRPPAAAGVWPETSWSYAPDLDAAAATGARWQRTVLVLLALTLAALFGPVAWGTLGDCWQDSNYSHGVLVPAVVVALMWRRRHDLVSWPDRDSGRQRLAAWGALATGGTFFVLGAAAAEQFTVRVSAVLMLLGLCGLLGGQRAWRRYGLPLLLLLCMVPVPYTLYYAVSFPLQLLSARLAAGGLDLLGLGVTRSGNIFEVNGQSIEVVRACSGIRSMMALGTLAAAAAVALRLSGVRAAILVLVAAPVAMLGNALRLVVTALLVLRFGPRAAQGLVHESVGLASFAVALALVGLVTRLLRRPRGGSRTDPRLGGGHSPALRVGGVRAWLRLRPWPLWAWVASARPDSTPAAWGSLALLVLVGGYGTVLRQHAVEPGPTPSLASFPMRIDALAGRDLPIDGRVLDQVRADAHIFRAYSAPGAPDVGLYVGYYRSQRQGAQIHSPMHCYPGAGWNIEGCEPLSVRDLDGRMSELRRLVVERDGSRDVVVYWYDTRTGRLTGDVALKLNLVRTALLHQPQDAAFVRWSTPVAEDEDLEAATTRLLTVAAHALPQLQAALPFGG